MQKQVVAVIFGGRSVEHDVSVLTGLQFIEALDPSKYSGLPVYIDPIGQWWTGEALKVRSNYPVKDKADKLVPLSLDLTSATAKGKACFKVSKKGLLGGRTQSLPFDVIVPTIHGTHGEDGTLQGLLAFANIAYTGSRMLASAQTMDKYHAKAMARSAGHKVLPEALVPRPKTGEFYLESDLKNFIETDLRGYDFPFIVKPRGLGSSVAVTRADTIEELLSGLLNIFKLDTFALIEPCITPLIEYNIAVRRNRSGDTITSAIERPLLKGEVLDFKNKYLSGHGKTGSKSGSVKSGNQSEGMASLNREINPKDLSDVQQTFIRTTATDLFKLFELAGSVRIDFLGNKDTGELWFNEINTIPGSFAYFLWEEADKKTSFLSLATDMIEEGLNLSKASRISTAAALGGSVIFKED